MAWGQVFSAGVKALLRTLASGTAGVSSAPHPSLLLRCTWEPAGDGPSGWVPTTHKEDLDWVPSSWLWPDPETATAGIWGSESLKAIKLEAYVLCHLGWQKGLERQAVTSS